MATTLFDGSRFLVELSQFLRDNRSAIIQFQSWACASEKWLQAEAAFWLNQHLAEVGFEDARSPWSVLLEEGRRDIVVRSSDQRPGALIECKWLYNNKNLEDGVENLRSQLSQASVDWPDRCGLVALTWVTFAEPSAYRPRGGKHTPDPPESFMNDFSRSLAEVSLSLIDAPVQLVSLDEVDWLYPRPRGATWLSVVRPLAASFAH